MQLDWSDNNNIGDPVSKLVAFGLHNGQCVAGVSVAALMVFTRQSSLLLPLW